MSEGIHSDAQVEASDVLETVLGEALPQLRVFHTKLKEEGEPRGLIGPRDVDILWERHILNSAAIVPYIKEVTEGKQFKSVADIGSGGGFPGLVAAAMLPDHQFTLVEPMERRVQWLEECVEQMGLKNVTVLRARSEEAIAALEHNRSVNGAKRSKGRDTAKRRPHTKPASKAKNLPQPSAELCAAVRHPFTVVTCRAVAPMTKLSGWTLPLVQSKGALVALKGRSAGEEITKARQIIARDGGMRPRVVDARVADGMEDTHVVIVNKK